MDIQKIINQLKELKEIKKVDLLDYNIDRYNNGVIL